MPHVPTVGTADRVFARLDRFQVACPSCGHLIFSAIDKRARPLRLASLTRTQSIGRKTPRRKRLWENAWNPLTHHLNCPACGRQYVVGLMLYEAGRGHRASEPPPDTVPNGRELAALRARTGGFVAPAAYQRGAEANVVVDAPCSCPLKGWERTCAIHGDPLAQGAKASVG